MKQIVCSFMLVIFGALASFGQTASRSAALKTDQTKNPAPADLLATITELDGQLFDAFNQRNLEMLKKLFATDVEFYHDKDGLVTYPQLIEGFSKLFERNQTSGLRRDLVKGTMAVYPLKDMGAIQTGEHRFCHMEQGREDCGTFKFLHIWRFTDGQWKLTRAVSFGH